MLLSLLFNVAPLATYTIIGLVGANLIVEKIALTCTVFVVLILSIVAWVNKTTIRSKVWVILLGLYFCLDYFITPLLIIAITQILDEWILCPLKAHYRNLYTINREIDKRI